MSRCGSGRRSRPRRVSMPRPEFPMTSSWQRLLPITGNQTVSSSSLPRWALHSSRACPVGKFHGIGPATSAKMNALGIFTGLDMRNQTLEFMDANFGKAGAYYYWISRGVDDRPVRANRIRKSVGAENTFSTDLTGFDAMVAELEPLIDKVWRHCESTG